MERVRIIVSGQVQGVGFRWSARRKAQELGLTGWVKNMPDGTLEIVCEGMGEAVRTLQEWCKTGPRGAEVTEVQVVEEPPETLASFEIR